MNVSDKENLTAAIVSLKSMNMSSDQILSTLDGKNKNITQKQLKSLIAEQFPEDQQVLAKMSKDDKVETVAMNLAKSGMFLSTMDGNGERTSYMASGMYEDEHNNKRPTYWRKAYPAEIENAVYRIISSRYDNANGSHLAVTHSNLVSVSETLMNASVAYGVSDECDKILISSKSVNSDGQYCPVTYYGIKNGVVGTMEELLEGGENGKGCGTEYCFRRFCDCDQKESKVPVIEEEDINLELVNEYAEKAKKEMAAYKGEWKVVEKNEKTGRDIYGWVGGDKNAYKVRFPETVLGWACGDLDLYVDILTISAAPLMSRKPDKTFFVLGEKANGKSTWRHLLKCVYGTRNCSDVQVAQMGSWDYASTLIGKMVNFPDEESATIDGANGNQMDTAAFKSMATHDNVVIRQKGSSVPFNIKCNFVSIIPMNEQPDWKHIDGGVIDRIAIVPFNADYSNERQSAISFEEQTYTPEYISKFIGELIGIAKFYEESKGGFTWSEAVESVSRMWDEEHNNVKMFVRDFKRAFTGYQNLSLLYESYQKWCRHTGRDYIYDTKARLKNVMAFEGYNQRSTDHATEIKVVKRKEERVEKGASLSEDNMVLMPNGVMHSVREILDANMDPVSIKLEGLGLKRCDD